MISALAAKILAGALAVVVVISLLLGWQLKRSWQAEATIAAQRDSLLVDNATLTRERDRSKKDAAAEAERAMARQRERDGLAANVAALRQRLSDASNTCVLPAGDLDAIDRFLRGEH